MTITTCDQQVHNAQQVQQAKNSNTFWFWVYFDTIDIIIQSTHLECINFTSHNYLILSFLLSTDLNSYSPTDIKCILELYQNFQFQSHTNFIATLSQLRWYSWVHWVLIFFDMMNLFCQTLFYQKNVITPRPAAHNGNKHHLLLHTSLHVPFQILGLQFLSNVK